MHPTAIIRELARRSSCTTAAARGQIIDAALNAARGCLDARMQLELEPLSLPEEIEETVAWDERLSIIASFDVVASVANPFREVSLAALRDAAVLPDIAVGEIFEVELLPRYDVLDATVKRALSCIEPLASFDDGAIRTLRAAVLRAVAELLVHALGWHEQPDETLLRLVSDGGKSVSGCSASSKATTLRLEELCWLLPENETPTGLRLRAGAIVTIEQDGTEERFVTATKDETVSFWEDVLRQGVSEEPRAPVGGVLEATADGLDQKNHEQLPRYLGADLIPRVLAAARQDPGDLLLWCRDALPELTVGRTVQVDAADLCIRLTCDEAHIDLDSLDSRGLAWVNVTLEQTGPRVARCWQDDASAPPEVFAQPSSIFVGQLDEEDIALPAPTPTQRTQIEKMVTTWLARLENALRYAADHRPHELLTLHISRSWTFDRNTQLVPAIGKLLTMGPPVPPVPPFDDAAIARAAGSIARPTASQHAAIARHYDRTTNKPLAIFRVASTWSVVLLGCPTTWPHDTSEIHLFEDGSDTPVQVLLTDVWNPLSRVCIDGDAFAFRRFTEWLRLGIAAADLDGELVFHSEGDDDDDLPPFEERMTIGDWLLIDEAPIQDHLVVDFRVDHHAVVQGRGLEALTEVFGFSDDDLARLPEDRRRWRRFLVEAIDPRFAASSPPRGNAIE